MGKPCRTPVHHTCIPAVGIIWLSRLRHAARISIFECWALHTLMCCATFSLTFLAAVKIRLYVPSMHTHRSQRQHSEPSLVDGHFQRPVETEMTSPPPIVFTSGMCRKRKQQPMDEPQASQMLALSYPNVSRLALPFALPPIFPRVLSPSGTTPRPSPPPLFPP